ncbi:MAG: serine/threonine-protein phosphatase [Methanobrevibacter sp. CfCl-M3]
MITKIRQNKPMILLFFFYVSFKFCVVSFVSNNNIISDLPNFIFILLIFPLLYGVYGALFLAILSLVSDLLIFGYSMNIVGDTLIAMSHFLIGVFIYKLWYNYGSTKEVTLPILSNIENVTKFYIITALSYCINIIFTGFIITLTENRHITRINIFGDYFFSGMMWYIFWNMFFLLLFDSCFDLRSFPAVKLSKFIEINPKYSKMIKNLIYIFLVILITQFMVLFLFNYFNKDFIGGVVINLLIIVILIILNPQTKKVKISSFKSSLKSIISSLFLISSVLFTLLIIFFIGSIYGKEHLIEFLVVEVNSISWIMIVFSFLSSIYLIRYFDNNFTGPLRTVIKISQEYIHNNSHNFKSYNKYELQEKNGYKYLISELNELSLNKKSEVGDIVNVMKEMITNLEFYIEKLRPLLIKEEKRILTMRFLSDVQRDNLPEVESFPERVDDFDIYYWYDYRRDLRGDFHDCRLADNDHLAILIGDTAGQNIPATLFTMKIKTMMQDYLDLQMNFEEILYNVNNHLNKHNNTSMFSSAFLGILTISTGYFRYSNAGHSPPLLYKKNFGGYKPLKVNSGLVLGLREGIKYPVCETYLDEGDRLCFYTYGIVERMNDDGEVFSLERLIEALNTNNDLNIEDLSLKVKEINNNFRNRDNLNDRTMLMIEYRKKTKKK